MTSMAECFDSNECMQMIEDAKEKMPLKVCRIIDL